MTLANRATLYAWFRGPHGLAHVYRMRPNGDIATTSGCGTDRLDHDKRGRGQRQKCDSCKRCAESWAGHP